MDGPKWLGTDVAPSPNSCMFCLPTITAPAALSRRTTSASSVGTRSANNALPPVVLTPAVSNKSLRPTGIPCRGPRQRPFMISASARPASAMACSAITVMNAFSIGFRRSIRARHAAVNSFGETFFLRTSSLASHSETVGRSGGACGKAHDVDAQRQCGGRTQPTGPLEKVAAVLFCAIHSDRPNDVW